jgi:hypothetical protein
VGVRINGSEMERVEDVPQADPGKRRAQMFRSVIRRAIEGAVPAPGTKMTLPCAIQVAREAAHFG